MSNFSTVERVLSVIRAGDDVEGVRGRNRCKVLSAANCNPPLTEELAKKMGVKINVEWGELLETLCKARGQLLSAFLSNQYFFTVKIPSAPPEHQAEWEGLITEEINLVLRNSLEYFELHRSRWSSVICHGVGPMMWMDEDGWLPRFRAMCDLRIPTDTTTDFRNLDYFSTRESYTVEALLDEVFNSNTNNRWDKKAVAEILESYKDSNFVQSTNNYDPETDPEKYLEAIKQNGAIYGGDALPVIKLWHFFFKDGDKWYQRVVPDNDVQGSTKQVFLWPNDAGSDYDKDHPRASSWREIIHCQYGDLSVDAPFKYQSVRGMGYVLLEPCFYKNLTLNRLLQHTHDNFNIWLSSSDNAEKSRVSIQEFANLGVVKQGLKIIPQAERHQIDKQLVEMTLASLTQLMSSASAQYTQQTDTGTQKEQTAFETRVKMEQVNAMMGSILMTAFKYESYSDREICRRFCKGYDGTVSVHTNEDIKKFQEKCIKAGIPKDFIDIEAWVIEPVTPLGQGNPTIAQAAVQQLLQIAPKLNAQAQNEINHEAIMVITKDYRKAHRWAPLSGAGTESDAKREMVGYFACLMEDVPVPLSQANIIDQLEALLPLYAAKIQKITKRDNMATADEATGLANVSDYMGRAIKQFSQDKTQKAKVHEFETIKSQQDNLARAIIQRGAAAREKQAKQAQNGANGDKIMEARLKVQEGQQRMQLDRAKAQQDMSLKEREFQQEMTHKRAGAAQDLQTDALKALMAAQTHRLKSIPKDDE